MKINTNFIMVVSSFCLFACSNSVEDKRLATFPNQLPSEITKPVMEPYPVDVLKLDETIPQSNTENEGEHIQSDAQTNTEKSIKISYDFTSS